jgi:HIV Tat-specific factor 1
MEFFQENPNGIVKIKFGSALHAEECKKVMNGRFFDAREIRCEYWDGKTDYRLAKESNEEISKRVDEFGSWLE